MTEQYGPPQRFKWVNQDTGEEYFDLRVSMVFDEVNQPTPAFGIKIMRELPEWMRVIVPKFRGLPMQSTGLRDAFRSEELSEGREIFYSDVVVDHAGMFYKIFWDGQATNAEPLDSTSDSFWVCQWHADRLMVVGNIYQRREQLEARARELEVLANA